MSDFDDDLIIIGAGAGGHGAALHAVKSGLKTAIIEAGDTGIQLGDIQFERSAIAICLKQKMFGKC